MIDIHTIQDVAKRAGVSVATVSRVLNKSNNVKKSTFDTVMEAVNELGYTPNLMGRNLRKNETKEILIIVPTIMNTFLSKVVKGIEDTAHENGYSVIIRNTYEDYTIEQNHINMVKNKLSDGIIMVGSTLSKQELDEISAKIPIVQCSEYTIGANVSYVTTDNFKAAYDAVSYLIAGGKRRILHFTVDNGFSSSIARLEGYKAALADNGIEFDKNLIEYGNYGYNNAVSVIKKREKTDFDAVFAVSDRMAAGCIRALEDRQIKVPDDVWVIGFDNIDISYILKPSITSVAQKQYEMGKKAVQILLEKISDNSINRKVMLGYKIVKRQSTAD